MLRRTRRPGFTLFQLLLVLALLLLLIALLLPAVAKVRDAAARMTSSNNLKQMMLAVHGYHDTYNKFPPGVDDNHFSASAHLLPFIEQDNLYKLIDFKKPCDDKANKPVRETVIKTFLSPRDPVTQTLKGVGPTNYLYNDQVFYLNSAVKLLDITDGTSNTVAIGETLKGDGEKKAVTVQRQHVLLPKAELKGLKDDAGEKPWKAGKNVVGDRCSAWIDGRFLQGTFNGRLKFNDPRPDVSCDGAGGVSALRTLDRVVVVAMGDGSVRSVNVSLAHTTWQALLTPAGGEVASVDD